MAYNGHAFGDLRSWFVHRSTTRAVPPNVFARVFGSFSRRDLPFGKNQVWRFALSTCSFEVEKEKWGLFIDSEGGSGVIGGETLASCKSGVFAANEERPVPVRNRF